jgi:predicted transcriptional regulator of viral defense system
MGKEKYQKEIEGLFKKSPVLDARSIARVIRSKKQVRQYDKQLIRNLVLRGGIKRLTKGYYTIYDDPSLAVFCFSPAYLGLQDALSFHNLWEQETIPVVITSRRVRPGIRDVLGANVLVRRLDKRYLFGFDYYKQGEVYVPYSNVEKTLIDMVYFREGMGDETIRQIAERLDRKRLRSYLGVYPKGMRERVLGMI